MKGKQHVKHANVHQLLSAIHDFLGTYSSADFTHASNYHAISADLRAALLALAREAKQTSAGRSAPQTRMMPHARATSSGSFPRRADGTSRNRDLLDILRSYTRLQGLASVLQYAKQAGLKVDARPKDSRERIVRRLAKAIEAAGEPKRSQFLNDLAPPDSDSQTQGWINVIKGSRP